MYALYKVEVWIKADLDSGTPLSKVLQEVENIPSGKVDFIDTEDYLTKTEKFVQPTEEATLKIYSDQGVELFTNKKE
jgi:hypothetical protein